MKKLLFMYPILAHHYLDNFTEKDLNLLEKTIDERYRKKGYQIYFLSFSDIARDRLCLVKQEDTVIFGNMCLDWNTIRLKERRERGSSLQGDDYLQYWQYESKRMLEYIDYPSFEDILEKLAPQEETVIAGVDPYNTPYLFTRYLQKLGWNAILDIELGKDFVRYSQYYGFSLCIYNPQNIIINSDMETLYSQGIYLYKRCHSLLLEDSVYRVSSYTSTISRIDAYLYKICVDSDFDFSRREEIFSSLQYLLYHLSDEERMTFQNKISQHSQEYIEFLFQACSSNGFSRFFFILDLLKRLFEKENIVSFASFKDEKYLYRRKNMGLKNKAVTDLLTFKEHLLEGSGNISFQTDNLSSDDIKMNELVDRYYYKEQNLK